MSMYRVGGGIDFSYTGFVLHSNMSFTHRRRYIYLREGTYVCFFFECESMSLQDKDYIDCFDLRRWNNHRLFHLKEAIPLALLQHRKAIVGEDHAKNILL